MKVKDHEFEFEFSLLRIDAGLGEPKQIHTDELSPYQYDSNTKVFHIVIMVGVVDNSFINCKPVVFANTACSN